MWKKEVKLDNNKRKSSQGTESQSHRRTHAFIQLEKTLPALLLQSLPTTKRKQGVESYLFIYEIITLLQGIRGKESE